MNIQEARELVAEYERDGALPDGYTVDTSMHESKQGNEYKIVYIRQDNAVVISYEVKNGHIEGEITLV